MPLLAGFVHPPALFHIARVFSILQGLWAVPTLPVRHGGAVSLEREKATESVALANRDYVGPYRLVEKIRAGLATEVWKAVRNGDDKPVAIKMLKPDHRKNRDEVARLRHEYNVGHKMNHPQVIRVYDFDVVQGAPYLALELYTTRNMKQAIQEDADALAPMLPQVIRQAAEGLEYVNRKGWVHTDVKPDNFLVSDDGKVKIIDLALAQKLKSGLLRLLSRGSKVQGTRSYMSPEQIRGQTLDVRSDVYNFGCTVFELVHGATPYQSRNMDDLLNKHLKTPVPTLASVNDNVTPEFSDLIARSMAKARQERPASMAEFLEEFRNMKVFWTQPRQRGKTPGQTNGTPGGKTADKQGMGANAH